MPAKASSFGSRSCNVRKARSERPRETVGQGLETVFLIALEDLVAGHARNAERAQTSLIASPASS